MKKIVLSLLILICFCNCNEKKETIDFVSLNETEFNSESFSFPHSKMTDSIKHVHDSCMGFSFDANAILVRTKDTFFIGSIVNRSSLKIINTINDLGLTRDQLIPEFNALANPCYEKRALHVPLKSVLGDSFILQVAGANAAMNKEINDAVSTSGDAEMQTGSWVYLDMKDALKKILDTTQNPAGLHYKQNLLDTSNMVLTTVESITDISFIINTGKDISEPLLTLLKNKPAASLPDSKFTIRLYYISNNKFQVSLTGFFPMIGQFMKAELK